MTISSVVLHAAQPGAGGHVHYIELDQFIGERYLVTVHGPLNPAVDPAAATVEVDAVLSRLVSGRHTCRERSSSIRLGPTRR
jgi:magnesium transporter